MRNPWRMIMFAIFLVLTICTYLPREAKAQPQDSQLQQNQSVVEAARRSRERKKYATTPTKVITNEDLDREHAKRGQEDFKAGTPAVPQTISPRASAVAAEAANQAATSANQESRLKSEESEEAAAEDAEIAKLKELLSTAQNDLIWQQRELLLNQNTIYSNPSYTTTQAGKAELDFAQLQIDQKQQEIEALKGPLANLEWRQWRRNQAGHTENGLPAENYESVPPSALVLPQP